MTAAPHLVFRLASPGDIPQLADLRWRLQTDDSATFDPDGRSGFIAAFTESVTRTFNNGQFFHWVAELDSRIVAVMSVQKVVKMPSPETIERHWGYLTNCYTLPEHRNQRVGARLLAAVTDWARAEKYELLAVWPSDRSYRFYKRYGFQKYADPLILKIKDPAAG
jgi:GNAT superfamily N-acetyltransferase